MKTKSLSGLHIKSEDEGTVSAVFSTFNVVDHDGDVTLPGAFTDGQKVRISAYNHESWAGSLPVGRGEIHQTETEAVMDGRFFLDTVAGRDTFQVVKEMGDLQEWSYGFDIDEWSTGEFDGQDVMFLRKLTVHEVSPVLLGAGIDTRTLAVKGLDRASVDELAKALLDHDPVEVAEAIAKIDMKLQDRMALAKATVSPVPPRLADVVAMRAEKGKSLGEESRARAVEFAEQLESDAKAMREVLTSAAEPVEINLDLDLQLARELARTRI